MTPEEMQNKDIKIILPDIDDSRIEELISEWIEEGIVLIVCWKKDELQRYEKYKNNHAIEFVEVPETETNMDYAAKLIGTKGAGFDWLLGGNISSTAKVVWALLKSVERLPGVNRISSYFLMESPKYGKVIFSDAGLAPDPSAEELAEIAHLSIGSTKVHRMGKIKLAFLRGGYQKEKMIQAWDIFKKQYSHDTVELLEDVTASEALDQWANILIFPNLDAGNIAYKLSERLDSFIFNEKQEHLDTWIVSQAFTSPEWEEYIFTAPLNHDIPTKTNIFDSCNHAIDLVAKLGMSTPSWILSFSTIDSGYNKGTENILNPAIDALDEITKSWRNIIPTLIQFDAGFIPEIGKKKGIHIEKSVKHYHFQSRQSFDICTEIAKNMQKSQALWPFIQGLAKEGNDASRGIDVDTLRQMLHIMKEKCIIASYNF